MNEPPFELPSEFTRRLKAEIAEQPWTLVRSAAIFSRILGLCAALFAGLVFLGYVFEIEVLYRPLDGGPASNPLTALCMLLAGLGLQRFNDLRLVRWPLVAALLIIGITGARLVDALFGTLWSETLMPFHGLVTEELAQGKNNSMGVNTAISFFCFALGLAAWGLGRPLISQCVCFVAVGLPMISIVGYAYGLTNFYGQMSLITASVSFITAFGALLLTADRGAVRAVLSPYISGTIARLQTLAGYFVPLSIGYFWIQYSHSSPSNFFGVYVVMVCSFIILMVGISAIFQERIDARRREVERELDLQAHNDALTQLPNRRAFFEFGHREILLARRSRQEFWVLMIDIDHFKKINDTAGHETGDVVLVEVAATIRDSVRGTDLVSRIGGEEFAVILVNSNRQGAERVAEHIRARIEAMVVEGWTDRYGPVTVSLGCAVNQGDLRLEDSLKSADDALYKAKQSGRNRVAFSGSRMNKTV